MTPSLANFLYSLLAGGAVLGAILAGLLLVSQKDKIRRR